MTQDHQTFVSSRRRKLRLLAAGAALVTLPGGFVGVAHAQTASPPLIEEVLITSQRRAANLQDVSVAGAALTGADLEKRAVTSISDLQYATPSLSVINQGFSQSINIRGVGLAIPTSRVTAGVAVYRDGAYLPTQTSLQQPFFDVQSVEVLRGPQGTFAGQTATGGAVYQTSVSPTLGDQVSGNVSAGYGTYKNISASGAVNVPLGDFFAVRVAINNESRDSFYTNLGASSGDPGNLDVKQIRVGLLWKPNDQLSVVWKNEYDQYRNDGYAAQPMPGSAFYELAPKDRFVINYSGGHPFFSNDYFISTLQADYKFENGIVLKSNTSYQDIVFGMAVNQSSSPAIGYWETVNSPETIWVQDISLASPTDGRSQWIVGATAVDYKTTPINSTVGTPTSSSNAITYTTKRSFGVFAQETYQFLPTMNVELGLRYSHDKNDQRSISTVIAGGTTTVTPSTSPTYEAKTVTGKAALNWTPDDDNLFYAFAARGYKPGGTNNNGASFDREFVWNYELGWKSTLFDGHVRSQFDVFYTQYKGFQFTEYRPQPQGSRVANAPGASSIKGFEAQTQLRYGGFGADVSLAYIDSKIAGILPQIDSRTLPNGGSGLGPQCGAGVVGRCFDYTPYIRPIPNGPNIYTPKVTANVGAQYQFEVGAGSSLTPRVDVSYVGKQWASFFELPVDQLKARLITNIRLTYEHDRWRIYGYVNNVFDKSYVGGYSVNVGNNYYLTNPRTAGVKFSASF